MLMLGAKQPMFVAWGPDLSFLYNDAYAPILGSNTPKVSVGLSAKSGPTSGSSWGPSSGPRSRAKRIYSRIYRFR